MFREFDWTVGGRLEDYWREGERGDRRKGGTWGEGGNEERGTGVEGGQGE